MPVRLRPRAPDGASVAKKSNQLRPDESEASHAITSATSGQGTFGTEFDAALTKLQVADLRQLIGHCSEVDRQYIASTVRALQQAKSSAQNTGLLLDCALYFESIGDFASALHVGEYALPVSASLSDINLQRRCHSIIGVILSRQCDFARALFHLEAALNIAKKMSAPQYVFAVRCNIAATLPYMGLMQDAKTLSIKNLAFPDGDPVLDQLHLQNSLNGIKLCQSLSDNASLVVFNRFADKKINENADVNCLTRAYYDAYHAFSLLLKEKPSAAYAYIREKIKLSEIENIRATSTLLVARGICAIKTKSQRSVKEADAGLTEILPKLKRMPFHYEDALRTLVSLANVDTRKSSRDRGVLLARELSGHLINVKHRQFFDRLQYERRAIEVVELSAPTYYISPQILPIRSRTVESVSNEPSGRGTQPIEATDLDRVHHWIAQQGNSASKIIERRLRSKEYDIAEEWAISADYFADRCGHHCLEVGALARMIALELQIETSEAVSIDLACRLHDIGKVLVDGTIQRNVQLGATDDYLVMREHTLMGWSLLSRQENPLFALASVVARSHHEWWNGCGHPDAISGANIPLAARICAVADAYLVLVRPSNNRLKWSKDGATQQLTTMSGVQLDPAIVSALLVVVGTLGNDFGYEVISSVSIEPSSRFVKARNSLIDGIA